MTLRGLGAALGAALATAGTAACELQFIEPTSERVVLRLALPAHAPRFDIVFEHSVLATTVTDRYEARRDDGAARLHLIEERFSGEGYGLPHAAGPGERLQRDGDAGWRLSLDRVVDPLVLRPQGAAGLRVVIGAQHWPIARLGAQPHELRVVGCASTTPR